MNYNYNKMRHFELLKYSQDLETKGKFLVDENREAFFELLTYQQQVNDHIFWQNRCQFVSLMKNFINGTLDAEKFSNEFFAISHENDDVYKAFTQDLDLKNLENFEPDSRSKDFHIFITEILNDCDFFEPDAEEDEEWNKKWLKDSVKDALVKIQKYL
jgi:hypothetical protein